MILQYPLILAIPMSLFNSAQYYIKMTMPAPYCSECAFPFKQMGACPSPDASIIYAYLSLLPYLIPLVILVLTIATRKIGYAKVFLLLSSAYLIGDKLIKPKVRGPRPLYSCKSSFGMPSSHMIVMAAIAFYRIKNSSVPLWQKVILVLLTIAQGMARIELNYHTIQQVIAGVLFAIFYTLIFQKIWQLTSPFFFNLKIVKMIFNCQVEMKSE